MNSQVQVLAPAGDFPSLMAGLEAGADEVYFGLAQLNMRAKARRTFEVEDLPEIVNRCHAYDAKALLALNTLMYDHDQRLVDKLLDASVEAGVDAIIAADMTVVLGARARGLEVHLSTQLSVSNFTSFSFYAQFCDRIVLARELTLPMISRLHKQIVAADLRGPSGRPMEIEAFAHGALCIAISGRCGMSLFTDNASANRGACVQNCRQEYTITSKDSGKQLVIDNEFIMSPNDISTMEFLDKLLEAGVAVLKLEGRGRSPEYVGTVTTAYRKAVDAVADGTYNKAFVEGLLEGLNKVYNRGLSSGYYLGRKQGWSKTAGTKATRQKIAVGKVTNYFSKIGVAEISATAVGLKVGDEYVIVGPTTGAAQGVVSELRLDAGPVPAVGPKDLFAMKVPQKVRLNDRVYLMRPI
ncbi:MAG: U32 family peptidase [Myxococcales bacterium]|nr:U32 family peptidase [Myxococcales bacterium]